MTSYQLPPPRTTLEEGEAPKRRRKKKLPKIISLAEANAILDAAEKGPGGVRDRALLETLYRAGLRVGEVVKLMPRDVESDGMIRIYDGKGGDGTAYFPPKKLLPILERWLAIRAAWGCDRPGVPLFCSTAGAPLSTRYVQRLMKRLKEQVGIRGVCTPHVLRHTFATELLAEGYTLTEVQQCLRHAHLQTTAVYLHVRDSSLLAKMQRREQRETE